MIGTACRRILFLLCAGILFSGCYGSPQIIKSEGEATPHSADGSPGDDVSGEEAVDEPIMVGGTFLTCAVAEDEIPPADLQKVGVGCRVEDVNDGEKVAISENIETSITVFNVYNAKVTSEVENAPVESRWHWYVKMPIDEFKGSNVEAKFVHKPTQYARVKTSTVAGEPIQLPGRPIPVDRPVLLAYVGQGSDLHVGDIQEVNNAGQSSLTKDCGAAMEPVERSGKVLRITFTVTGAPANIGISLNNICGVTHGQQNPNLISVSRKDTPSSYIDSKDLITGSANGLLGFKVEGGGEGDYVLTIAASKNFQGNFDDFVIGEVEFRTDKAVNVSMETVEAEQLNEREQAQRANVIAQVFGEPRGEKSNDKLINLSVVGPNITHYRYMLDVGPNVSCGDINRYSEIMPTSTPIQVNLQSHSDGQVKVCVIGKDNENFWQSPARAAVASWIKDTVAQPPRLSGVPANGSTDAKLNISVVSGDVIQYRYKVGKGIDCDSSSGYGEWRSIGTKITDDLGADAEGAYTVCVVGRDELGNVQPYREATKATWNKAVAAAEEPAAGLR